MRGSPEVRRLAAGTLMPGFAGTTVPDWVRRARDEGVGSLALYGSNVTDPGGLAPVLGRLRELGPLLLATDEEGGDVTRVHYPHGSPEPGNAVLGRLDDPARTYDSARRIGTAAASLGISLVLGPVLDVNSAADNPVIGVRSFGADPELVARHGTAWIRGVQSTGVASCAKHFPGHGATHTDSHLTVPVVTAERAVLERRELVPFRAAITAGVPAVMSSHLLVPALDPDTVVTFSSRVIEEQLRGGLGFTGTVVTDALDMVGASDGIGIPAAAVRALAAGCDLLCLGSRTDEEQYDAVVDAIVDAVTSGRLSAGRLEQALDRIGRLSSLTSEPGPEPVGPVGDVTEAFELTASGRAWLDLPGPALLVQVESAANEAVGRVGWGPANIEPSVVVVHPDGKASADPLGAGPCKVAVIGRAIDGRHPALDLAARLRANDREVVVVECGWPRGTADITSFGSSPVVAAALVALLTGRSG
ncbi:glycoside hydrolase family 3 protein [Nostocoides sp. F2B08]|uniref:glycoside hydrolase family 3 protein n=1 Tax=Nostocoides sp. F2B08 TaxID=2653936 RepID=UPI00186B2E47|nr:glycoside hydrolase family 3 protein [Tetrasphaera sp. F2B08]